MTQDYDYILSIRSWWHWSSLVRKKSPRARLEIDHAMVASWFFWPLPCDVFTLLDLLDGDTRWNSHSLDSVVTCLGTWSTIVPCLMLPCNIALIAESKGEIKINQACHSTPCTSLGRQIDACFLLRGSASWIFLGHQISCWIYCNILQQRKGHLCSVHGMASRYVPPIFTIHHRPSYLHAAQVELLHLRGSHVGSVHSLGLLNPVNFPAMPLTGRFQERLKKGLG